MIAREFTKEDEYLIFDMINEINEFDRNFEGWTDLGRIENFDDYLCRLEIWKKKELINPNFSPQTTFGIFDNNELIGGFIIRHVLKGKLFDHGGNIGYLIRPSKRNMGYGKRLLKIAIEESKKIGLDKVLVTCREENVASAKVIEANGGVLENVYYDKKENIAYRRYWIEHK